MDTQPLVSCIMPTYNRRAFVPHAIEYFFRQDYENRELIVVDDGMDSVQDLMPNDSRIRYVRLNKKHTLGAKLNLACEAAHGDIVAHWDDDDWYAPRRLSYQVDMLIGHGKDVCGINQLLYYDLQTGQAYCYRYPSHQRIWLLGSELCYQKRFWSAHRFADINVGMDARFVWSAPPRSVLALPDHTFAVHMIHRHNVSPKRTKGAYWNSHSVEEIANVMGHDWECYRRDVETVAGQPQLRISTTSGPEEGSALPNVPAAETRPIQNVFACLVHEGQECVVDLVRNLRLLDPDSIILLYNGGSNPQLLNHGYPFERYGALVHPSPRPMRWGWLHEFALDCMSFALQHLSFDTITIVDSDQLAVRPGYSRYLGAQLTGQQRIGLLGSLPDRQPATTRIPPAMQAWKEVELWRPFLKRFHQGEDQFIHWTFWPSTVFTADAARDLTKLFDTDRQLQTILQATKIWASEEVILPTLVALLGYLIVTNPCSYDYVKYRVAYSLPQIDSAARRSDVFWMHPVPRQYNHPIRARIRQRFQQYTVPAQSGGTMPSLESSASTSLLLFSRVLARMRSTEGWLEDDEASLLMGACANVLTALPPPHHVVEVGSYCGRSTVVLGAVIKALSPTARLYAVDPHDGKVGALDQGVQSVAPTVEKFKRNIAMADLTDVIEIVQQCSYEVSWDKPISLLFIDGLHDYVNVARDCYHFERWLRPCGLIAFHDYADYYPGVKAFVDELLATGRYVKVHLEKSMMVLKKTV